MTDTTISGSELSRLAALHAANIDYLSDTQRKLIYDNWNRLTEEEKSLITKQSTHQYRNEMMVSDEFKNYSCNQLRALMHFNPGVTDYQGILDQFEINMNHIEKSMDNVSAGFVGNMHEWLRQQPCLPNEWPVNLGSMEFNNKYNRPYIYSYNKNGAVIKGQRVAFDLCLWGNGTDLTRWSVDDENVRHYMPKLKFRNHYEYTYKDYYDEEYGILAKRSKRLREQIASLSNDLLTAGKKEREELKEITPNFSAGSFILFLLLNAVTAGLSLLIAKIFCMVYDLVYMLINHLGSISTEELAGINRIPTIIIVILCLAILNYCFWEGSPELAFVEYLKKKRSFDPAKAAKLQNKLDDIQKKIPAWEEEKKKLKKQLSELENSTDFQEASKRNDALKQQDKIENEAFALKWQREWYDYCNRIMNGDSSQRKAYLCSNDNPAGKK